MKKWHVVLAIVIVFYVGIMIYFIMNDSSRKDRFLFLSENTMVGKVGNRWRKMYLDEVPGLEIYSKIRHLGTMTAKKEDIGYRIYDENEQLFAEFANPIIGYTNDFDIEIQNFETEAFNSEDKTYVNTVLEMFEINGYSYLNTSKLNFDFNEDGLKETIYMISNVFEESEYNHAFSIIYTVRNGRIEVLYKEVEALRDKYNVGSPYFHSVIKEDGDYKVIIGIQYFSEAGTRYLLYQFKDHRFQEEFNIR